MSSNYVDIDVYSLYKRDRKKRRGGGVCIYVKDILLSCVYYFSNDFKVIWVKVCCNGYCFFIAACYHPPNFKYNPFDFVNQLCGTIELIINQENRPIFIITGDFNLLCTDFLEEKFGFSQLVQDVTQGINLLDKVFY